MRFPRHTFSKSNAFRLVVPIYLKDYERLGLFYQRGGVYYYAKILSGTENQQKNINVFFASPFYVLSTMLSLVLGFSSTVINFACLWSLECTHGSPSVP